VAVAVAEEAQVAEDHQVADADRETTLDLQDVTLCQTQAAEAAEAEQTLVVQESARLPIG
jgi:alkyl sulfatase BDS1-like metallo-beta-lactamase superfamily hydrolase